MKRIGDRFLDQDVNTAPCAFDAGLGVKLIGGSNKYRLRACFIQDVFVPRDVLAAGVQQPTMWFTRDAASMRAEGWPEWEVDWDNAVQARTSTVRGWDKLPVVVG